MAAADLDGLPGKYEKLGSCMYLFKSDTNTHEALISAHGGYYTSTKTFKIPQGMTVHFWAPHSYVLKDPGVKLMYSGRGITPVETRTGGQNCIDYALTKYQGSHGGSKGKPAETYASIVGVITQEDTRYVNQLKKLENAKDDRGVDLALNQIAAAGAMNVITIRNRALRGEVWLSTLVAKVRKHAPRINVLHCSFCRSLTTSTSDPAWNISTGHAGFTGS